MTNPAPARTARLVMEEDATAMHDLWALNLIAEDELRNNVVRARNGDACYYTPTEIVELIEEAGEGRDDRSQ